jgi:tetratricopeptide (TPR) repeat protein
MAMGDSVNTAAGLQAAARPDTVLVGERTRRIVDGLFAWGGAREFTLKGKADSVVACEARMRRPGAVRPAGETELIGRAAELDEGVACLRAVRAGTGGVLAIVGDAGVGKSRLLAELRARFAAEGAWLAARCASYEQAVPYRPLESLLGDRMLAVLDAAAREDLAPADRRRRAAAALRAQLADIAAQRPVAIVIDDAHWMDPSSAALLGLVLPATEDSALLMVLAARPERDAPIAALLAGARRIELTPLTADAGRRLVRALAYEPLEPDVEREVVERAAGNPFYLHEFVRSLAGGRRDDTVPDAIERVILARVDRLPVPAREAVAAAAVLGRSFDAALLDAVSEVGPALPEALDELVRERLVVRERRDYGFAHTLLQETVYGSLLRSRRRELHGRAASALRELAPSEHALIAAHFAGAGDDRSAMGEHGQAAAAAFKVGALEESIAQDDAALAAAQGLGEDAGDGAVRALLQRRSWSRALLGDRRGGRADAERALAAARDARDRRGRLAALVLIGLLRDGDIEPAAELQHEALALARSLGDREAEVEILARLAILLVARLQLDQAVDHAARAEELAVASGSDRLLGKALDAAKLVALNLGDLDRVAEVCARLQAIHRAQDDRFMLAFALLEGAFVPLARGHWRAAEDRLQRAIDMNATSGNAFTRPLFLDAVCWMHRSRGALDEALAAGLEANRVAEEVGIPEFAAWTAATLGWALLDGGDAEEAARILERGLSQATSVGATVQALRCAGLLAEARLRSGDHAGARAAAGHAEVALAVGSTPPNGAFVYGAHAIVALARARLALGDGNRAEALVKPLHLAAERSGWLEAIADCATVLAETRLTAGDTHGAAELAQRAMRAARDGQLPRAQRDARAALAAAGAE